MPDGKLRVSEKEAAEESGRRKRKSSSHVTGRPVLSAVFEAVHAAAAAQSVEGRAAEDELRQLRVGEPLPERRRHEPRRAIPHADALRRLGAADTEELAADVPVTTSSRRCTGPTQKRHASQHASTRRRHRVTVRVRHVQHAASRVERERGHRRVGPAGDSLPAARRSAP